MSCKSLWIQSSSDFGSCHSLDNMVPWELPFLANPCYRIIQNNWRHNNCFPTILFLPHLYSPHPPPIPQRFADSPGSINLYLPQSKTNLAFVKKVVQTNNFEIAKKNILALLTFLAILWEPSYIVIQTCLILTRY